jgi:hypothetical protein
MSSLFADLQESFLISFTPSMQWLLAFSIGGVIFLMVVLVGLGVMRRWLR